jgi:predicted ester cyclase
MSVEENKEVVRRWNEEGWSEGNLDVIDELAAEDYIHHRSGLDRAGTKQNRAETLAAFSGGITLEKIVGQGDMVAVSWRMHYRQTAEFKGVAPTGEEGTIHGISMYRLADGKIVEDWSVAEE